MAFNLVRQGRTAEMSSSGSSPLPRDPAQAAPAVIPRDFLPGRLTSQAPEREYDRLRSVAHRYLQRGTHGTCR
jgi:hypothetical protein